MFAEVRLTATDPSLAASVTALVDVLVASDPAFYDLKQVPIPQPRNLPSYQ